MISQCYLKIIAKDTCEVTGALYGMSSHERIPIEKAWEQVGIKTKTMKP